MSTKTDEWGATGWMSRLSRFRLEEPRVTACPAKRLPRALRRLL